MSATVTKGPPPQKLSLDLGNYSLKTFDGQGVRMIRSLQTSLAKGQSALKGSDASPLIELDGQRWHVGAQCQRYARTDATVIGDKTQLAQLHLAACLTQSGDYQLVVSHHSPLDVAAFLRTALLGEHHYCRNGVLIRVTVRTVEVVAEGWGAYQLAKSRNYLPARGYTVLIDLGGSTWLSSIYAPDGEVIDHDVHERQGTFALAAAIAKDTRLSKPLVERFSVTSPDPVLIQDGFTQGPEYLDPWWKSIVQTLKARYQTHLPNVRRFLITGGGSHLIAHKVAASPAFLVLPEASTANVQGAYLAGSTTPVMA